MPATDLQNDAAELLQKDMTPEAAALLLGLEAIAQAIRYANEFPTDLAIGNPLNNIAAALDGVASAIEHTR